MEKVSSPPIQLQIMEREKKSDLFEQNVSGSRKLPFKTHRLSFGERERERERAKNTRANLALY